MHGLERGNYISLVLNCQFLGYNPPYLRSFFLFFIKILTKIIKILNSDETPFQVGTGFALGSLIGLTPILSIQNLVILFFICILNISFMSGILGILIMIPISYLLDPISLKIGYSLLVESGLDDIWMVLYNMPLVPLTRFNNTHALGSLVLAIILFLPNLLFARWAVKRYRERFQAWFIQTKFYKFYKASKVFIVLRKVFKFIPGTPKSN